MSDWDRRRAAAWVRAEQARTARERAGVSIEQALIWEEGWRVGRGETFDVVAAVVEAAGGVVRVPGSVMDDPPMLSVMTDRLGRVIFRSHRR